MTPSYYGQDLNWLTAELENWKKAHTALSLGQTIVIAGRTLTRVDLPYVQGVLFAIKAEIDRQNTAASGNSPSRCTFSNFSGINL